jgi:pimeloyl-ACP methyl ester carboxylesterase
MTSAPLAPGERHEMLEGAGGVELSALLASGPEPRGVMLLCHGLTTDSSEHGAFLEVRDHALRRGLAVARYDARAHGRSGGANEELRLELVRRDADTVMEWVDGLLGADVPVIPVGVSFGGAAAIHVAFTRGQRCAGLVLWYAVVDYEGNYGPRTTVGFTHRMRAAHSSADPPWSAMPVLGSTYHVPAGMLAEMPADPTHERIAALTVPVLSFHGSRDPFVDPTPLERLASDHPNIDFRTAWGAGHGFLLWRPWVVRRTAAWAAQRVRRAAPQPRSTVRSRTARG